MGMYLGPSPVHARFVSLVFNIHTGLVSPQFHVKYDIAFETIKHSQEEHQWPIKAGFLLSKLFLDSIDTSTALNKPHKTPSKSAISSK